MAQAPRIAFFDTKPYDRRSFERVNTGFGFEISYFEERLHKGTVAMPAPSHVSEFIICCVFVGKSGLSVAN